MRDPEVFDSPLTVTVVVPTKDDAANLAHVLPFIPDWVDEILIVDAGSTDGTVDIALSLLPRARVATALRKGKVAALFAGLEDATGDLIVAVAADGSTDPREIPAFVGALLAGGDMAKGSRFMQGGRGADMELRRRLCNRALKFTVNGLFGGRYTDPGCPYFAVRRSALPALISAADDLSGADIGTILGIRALKNQLAITEVASFEVNRNGRPTDLGVIRRGVSILKVIKAEFFDRGARKTSVRGARLGLTLKDSA